MGDLRTLLTGALVALGAQADVARAGEDALRWFAGCTGRLSAEMEHEWLLSDPASDQTRKQRDAMWSLAEAVMPPGAQGMVMGWRVEAKQAQADLLTLASFAADPGVKARARLRAQALVENCTAALLG